VGGGRMKGEWERSSRISFKKNVIMSNALLLKPDIVGLSNMTMIHGKGIKVNGGTQESVSQHRNEKS